MKHYFKFLQSLCIKYLFSSSTILTEKVFEGTSSLTQEKLVKELFENNLIPEEYKIIEEILKDNDNLIGKSPELYPVLFRRVREAHKQRLLKLKYNLEEIE